MTSTKPEESKKHIRDILRIDQFTAPFKIIIDDSHLAELKSDNPVNGQCISENVELFQWIALYRVINEHRIRGCDIKFLRKCLCLRASEVAKYISVSREHFSRCENGSASISGTLEVLLRIYIFTTAAAKLGPKLGHHNFSINDGINKIFMLSRSKEPLDEELVLQLKKDLLCSENTQEIDVSSKAPWVMT